MGDSILFYARREKDKLYLKSDSLNKQQEIELYDLKNDSIGKPKLVGATVFGSIQTLRSVTKKHRKPFFTYTYEPIAIPDTYFPRVILDENFNLIEFDWYNGMQYFTCVKKK
jgi:hypothetical protein